MLNALDYLRALAGAFAAMAVLIATELALLTTAVVGYALIGGLDVPLDALQSPIRWAFLSGALAMVLTLLAAPTHEHIVTHVFRTIPAQLVRRTLPAQLVVVGVVELLLVALGRIY